MAFDWVRNWLAITVFAGFAANVWSADKPRLAAPIASETAGVELFEKRIRPLFIEHCYSCHSSEAKKLRGHLLLDTGAGLLKGGDSGPAIVPGNPGESLLLEAVRYTRKDLQMPPKAKLSAMEIADLETWVRMGAPVPRTSAGSLAKAVDRTRAREFWSFRPIQKHPVPSVKDETWPVNEIDRFVLHRLEEKGLTPVEPADKRSLIRRATYDLIGLPPTPEEIDAFLADDSPDAFARIVDRLLASPHYGERWGRHWLDVVRYADTAGDNSDYPIPQMYKYRNWVLQAIAQDKPYDQFVREQVAGDLMGGADDRERRERIIATGYLANARRFGSLADPRYPWHLTIEDTIDNLGRTFLGLTINCCRCHDHKFDPLTNEDYYSLYGFFQSTRYPWAGIELYKAQQDLVPLEFTDRALASAREHRQKLAALAAKLAQLDADKEAADKALLATEKLKDEAQRATRVAEIVKRLGQIGKAIGDAEKERDNFAKKPLPYEAAYAVSEEGMDGKKRVGNACIQIKGDPQRLGKEVPRRFPEVLGGMRLPEDAKGSGRLELARWLTDPANPLTARVMVNRIWHYHFGKGLVQTPSNFGKQGKPPTHPELLDYLARRFIASGWSLKAMHRLMMLSRTYQLSSREDAANARLDAANDYLWHFRRRRLEAECLRDTLLAASGTLDRSMAGPHPFPDPQKWDFTEHNVFKAVYETNRRSVYLMTQRVYRHPFLGLFDGAATNASTDHRIVSTTPLQALYLMNDPFIHAQAKAFATRLLDDRPDDAARIRWAYLLLFGRPPNGDEETAAQGYLAQVRRKIQGDGVPAEHQALSAWQSLARALFMCSELVYVN
jgi:mono/diheme cytochrome c family protein